MAATVTVLCRACREDLRTWRSRRGRTTTLPPSHRLPLSTEQCTACAQPLAQSVVDRGGTRHASCGDQLEGVWR